jgi:hypothetical protein
MNINGNLIEETIDLTGILDYMIGYHIVSKIYEIRDHFIFADERIDYDTLIMNLKILNHITEVNFVFVKDIPILDQIKEIMKVGNLMNFQVYLDPLHDDTISMLAKGEKHINFKIKF